MIDQLAARVSAMARPFGLEVIVSPVESGLEEAGDEKGPGWFLPRSIQCRSPQDRNHTFLIHFDEVRDFRKPWPYLGVTHTLADGNWHIGRGGSKGKIELQVDDEGIPKFLVSTEEPDPLMYSSLPKPKKSRPRERDLVPLDEAWLMTCFGEYTGTRLV
jgi:hypothetical protein